MKKLFSLFFVLIVSLSTFAELYIVTGTTLNVRNKPSAQSQVLGKLQKGTKIDVKEVINGFASFDFNGSEGYASVKYLKKTANGSANQETSVKETKSSKAQEAVKANQGNATIYLFFDITHYFSSFPIEINKKYTFYMEGKEKKSKMTGTRYGPSMRKINVKGEGRVYFSLDFKWADKPYHSDLTLDVVDGGEYYVKVHLENFVNFVTKKRGGFYFKQLTPKDGQKELKKKEDRYTLNPDVNIAL